ncbi:hypothetical protein CEE69_09665 [Rhodopirellula bahusiensis]|uniref:Uncharacterized protein n=1 Tax=Rhodopirellula bahusiensis TaxID=2014065 RepID=A0A2G1W8E0_9BACT|nr:hypothetical protein CEE69_09665 [Rhodopirellula bahusiensis]
MIISKRNHQAHRFADKPTGAGTDCLPKSPALTPLESEAEPSSTEPTKRTPTRTKQSKNKNQNSPLNPTCLDESKQANQHRLKATINRVDDHCLGESNSPKTECFTETFSGFLARIEPSLTNAKVNPGKINGFF